VLPVERVTGKGVKNVRVGSLEEGKRGAGEKMLNERKVEVRVGGEERKTKVRRVGEGVAADGGVVVKEGVGGYVRVKVVEQKSCVQPLL